MSWKLPIRRPACLIALLITASLVIGLTGCATAEVARAVGGSRRVMRDPSSGDRSTSKGAAPGATARERDGAESITGRPPIDIRFDFEVVDMFLEFIDRGETNDEELDRWAHLQGNRELLRRGRFHGGLNQETLKKAARITAEGGVFPAPHPLGRIDVGPWDLLRRMVASIKARREELISKVSRHLAGYLPRDRRLPPLRVFFHLGGDWDGRAADSVYINLTFFQARGMESLPGLDALLVHELYHLVQSSMRGVVDDYSSRHSALYTVLQRTHQEGIARHLEYHYMESEFTATALDRTNFNKYRDGLRHARDHAAILQEILEELSKGGRSRVRSLAGRAFLAGGPLYAVGHSMAETIERRMGREALADTVVDGPIAFFEAYSAATAAANEPSLLPPDLEEEIKALKAGYAGAAIESSRLRREGLLLLQRGRRDDAIEALTRATRIDATDFISAYNLACAYALAGEVERALRWLERALERGFDNYKHMRVDPDLESLHREPGFAALLSERGIRFTPPEERGPSAPVTP